MAASESATDTALSREDLGFLLAKAAQRWNELLAARVAAAADADGRPSSGSVLLPLFVLAGLLLGEPPRRARLSKQTMTSMIGRLERDGLVERQADPNDARASLIFLTTRSRRFAPVASATLRELEALTRHRLGPQQIAATKDALRRLIELG